MVMNWNVETRDSENVEQREIKGGNTDSRHVPRGPPVINTVRLNRVAA